MCDCSMVFESVCCMWCVACGVWRVARGCCVCCVLCVPQCQPTLLAFFFIRSLFSHQRGFLPIHAAVSGKHEAVVKFLAECDPSALPSGGKVSEEGTVVEYPYIVYL